MKISNKETNFITNIICVSEKSDHEETILFLESLNKFMFQYFANYEYIIVCDGISERQSEKLEKHVKYSTMSGKTSLIKLNNYHGIELAMKAGVDMSIGDYIFQWDKTACGWYTDEMVFQAYQMAISRNDIVVVEGKNTKSYFSRVFYGVYNSQQVNEIEKIGQQYFSVLSRRAINRLQSMTATMPYRKIQYRKSGLNIAKIQYESTTYEKLENKEALSVNKEVAINAIISYTDLIAKLSMGLSIMFLFISFIIIVYVFIVYFGHNKPVEGWAPTMGFLGLGFFGVFMILTIVIKYLSIIQKLLFIKHEYLISEIKKI